MTFKCSSDPELIYKQKIWNEFRWKGNSHLDKTMNALGILRKFNFGGINKAIS